MVPQTLSVTMEETTGRKTKEVAHVEALVLALLMLAAVLRLSVIDQLVPKMSSPLIQIGLGLLIALFAPSQIRSPRSQPVPRAVHRPAFVTTRPRTSTRRRCGRTNARAVAGHRTGARHGAHRGVRRPLAGTVHPLGRRFRAGRRARPTDAVAVASLSKGTSIPARPRAFSKASPSSTTPRASCRSNSPWPPSPPAPSRSSTPQPTSCSASSAASSWA